MDSRSAGFAVLDVYGDQAVRGFHDVLRGDADVCALLDLTRERVLVASAELDLLGSDADGDLALPAGSGRRADDGAVIQADRAVSVRDTLEEVGDAEELRDEGRRRPLVEVVRRAE